ncbi:ferritin-like domain-containing protein [Hymenobacter sp. HMF4947]|uniref:Ferritin-like domain-containing protein n=1 Tax=Hymenobacter ginkgonis TaxID=2682976 RepID=A0A7K1TES4_9BACT|nr:ferritin-like domain-containing protein [Hymenobacter ginkgonis]MVN76792.1 ferritin-like domain-containing protein [Hymenobacter ginkgonis]
MDFFQLLSDLEKADAEFLDRINPRRRVFKYLGNAGQKITTAAVPAVLASFFNRAYGQSATLTAPVQAVLTLALQLEYLEYHFYNTALGIAGLIPSQETAAITTIRNDEAGHINALRAVLGTAAPTPYLVTDFDYSGGSGTGNGPMKNALIPGSTGNTNGALFFAAGQAFSDTGQRAYKGGAPVLNTTATKDILEAALNIHSVEARHNSHFRTVRRAIVANALGSAGAPAVSPYDAAPKSWISLVDNGGPTAPDGSKPASKVYGPGTPATGTPDASYPGEDNTSQAGVNLTTLGSTYTAAAISEAFDEPLDPATVKSIASMFTSTAGKAKGLFV